MLRKGAAGATSNARWSRSLFSGFVEFDRRTLSPNNSLLARQWATNKGTNFFQISNTPRKWTRCTAPPKFHQSFVRGSHSGGSDDDENEKKKDKKVEQEEKKEEKEEKKEETEPKSDAQSKPSESKPSESKSREEEVKKKIAPSLHLVPDGRMILQKLSYGATPKSVSVMPLNLYPVFGGSTHTAIVERDLFEKLQRLKSNGQTFVGLFYLKKPVYGRPAELYSVGQLGSVISAVPYTTSPELWQVVVACVSRRIRIKPNQPLSFPTPKSPSEFELLNVEIDELMEEEASPDDETIKNNQALIEAAIKDLQKLDSNPYYQVLLDRMDPEAPGEFADLAASAITSEPHIQQQILETMNIVDRQKLTLELLQKKLRLFKIHKERPGMDAESEKKWDEEQRRIYLEKKKKSIERELSLGLDEKEVMLQNFTAKLEGKKVPDHIMHVINEEMDKLSTLEKGSSEFNVSRTYLQWLTQLPWGMYNKENLNVSFAAKVLDKDHYGLKDVKERILEFISVGNLRGSLQGKILCLVGPPGVGKTSIGSSIAKSLEREFFRFSVGGMSDVAEIKGHRRTYMGAMPGKIIQSLKGLNSSNPVILIDEVDKMGRSFHGDPSSALLEVLDPEQNASFLDHYLDVPVDLSKVLFVCTANVTDTIPGPLLDRMEVIRLSGYVHAEKMNIAKNYLAPTKAKECGVPLERAKIMNSALSMLIQSYCREAGVRDLEKHIEKIFRKIAVKMAREEKDAKTKYVVTQENLHEYVGHPKFTSDRYYDVTVPGVVMGLAWTSMGGATLYIETVDDKYHTTYTSRDVDLGPKKDKEGDTEQDDNNKPTHSEEEEEEEEEIPGVGPAVRSNLTTTGQMGGVMKESTDIAHTFSRNFLAEIMPDNRFFDSASIHMHIPEGATPKDGPSAGVTMVTSLLSLALGKPVDKDIAMTGEITLTGKVLTIGGVKEKTIAARRSGAKRLIFPAGNQKDWDELPDYITKGLKAHFVKDYKEIYDILFTNNNNKKKKKKNKNTKKNGEQ